MLVSVLAAKVTDDILGCHWQSIDSRSRKLFPPLCSALVNPQLECSIQFWMLQYKRDMNTLEVQKRSTKMLEEIEDLTWKEWLRELGLVNVEKRKLREILSADITT